MGRSWTGQRTFLALITTLVAIVLGSLTILNASPSATAQQQLLKQWDKDIKPMLEHYCYDCHGDGRSKGDLDLDDYPDLASMRKDPKVWEHILARVQYHLMPPPEEEQMEQTERKKLIAWVNDAIFPANLTDPGQRAMRRLNRIEYENTIHDLLGTTAPLSQILPPDDSGNGFDNNGESLSISPAHIEKYLIAAETALNDAILVGPMPPRVISFKKNDFNGDGHQLEQGTVLYTRGSISIRPKLRLAGKYHINIIASASQAGDEPTLMDLVIDGKRHSRFEVKGEFGEGKTFTKEISLNKRVNSISLVFPNDYYDSKAKNEKLRDRNLMIHAVHIEGPIGVKREKPITHRRIFITRQKGQTDQTYTRMVLENFARRAFRRPVTQEEIDRYMTLSEKMVREGGSLEHGIRSTLSAMLVSPSFLFITRSIPEKPASHRTKRIDQHNLANQLSYFLWSSMPDDELMTLADTGKLYDQLDQQITRMLKNPRSKEMVSNFSGQWLQLRDLNTITPDKKRFPVFSLNLASHMRTETEMLSDYILRENRSLLDFLDADYTFINERMAALYKIPNIKGGHFRKVTLKDNKRRGILTHASILTLTSQPNRTSPVLRGKFILENILDITPPPPPPDLPGLEEIHDSGKRMTIREQLAMHREKTACAGCHNLMDPIGLAFEKYNGIGVWREFENRRAIDTSGQLVTGETISGVESLRLIILNKKKDEFLRCLTVKLMTYALGRGVTRSDRLHVEKILTQLKQENYSAHSLIKGIIHSVPFQYQRH